MLSLTLAHEGHGSTDGSSLIHYLLEPAHLPYTLTAAAIIVGFTCWAILRKRRDA